MLQLQFLKQIQTESINSATTNNNKNNNNYKNNINNNNNNNNNDGGDGVGDGDNNNNQLWGDSDDNVNKQSFILCQIKYNLQQMLSLVNDLVELLTTIARRHTACICEPGHTDITSPFVNV